MCDRPAQAEPYLLLSPSLIEAAQAALLRQQEHVAVLAPAQRQALRSSVLAESARYSSLIEDEAAPALVAGHAKAEAALIERGLVGARALSSASLIEIHSELSRACAREDLKGLRQVDVQVGGHVAPAWASVPAFLERADQVYLAREWSPAELVVVVACAHQRTAWIHPFRDFNGRAIRLQSSLVLRAVLPDSWSLSAALYARRQDYMLHLAEADRPRLGDLDGRGNLSQRMLAQWVEFFVSVVRGVE